MEHRDSSDKGAVRTCKGPNTCSKKAQSRLKVDIERLMHAHQQKASKKVVARVLAKEP